MPPRKKANSSSSSSSKKSQSSQHIKYGIQHFFQRHSQSQSPKSFLNPKPDSNILSTSSNPFSVNKNASDSVATTFENTPPNDLVSLPIGADVDKRSNSHVSPEISKSVSIKRFKFSPGMLIKQSQDDGGDEVTWKISPINERLQAASKHNPDTLRVLADSSRQNSLLIRQCSHDKTIEASPGTSNKVDKWLSSPMPKVTEGSLVSANGFCLKKVNPNQDVDLSSQGSPFRTPPSLSYHHDKVKDITCDEECNQLDAKQNKKALLELLDQVEDVISVDSISTGLKACSSKFHDNLSDKIVVKAETASKTGLRDPPTKVNGTASDGCFLVLEVSEKRSSANPSGAQCPCKVLRILNELSGEERTVCLWEEWFYSVIAPGDTVNVIGEFDDRGKCDVDRDNNLLIVHPFILVSGTRVAASFSCPRRTVLDERLKCSEQSTAALIGTMLHQIFQAGLVKEAPNVTFLEEYARIVLQKNIESLYACGANENEILKTLIEAIPKLLNWIILFKNSQHSEAPAIFFGTDDGPRKVKISEVIDIEEMAWAPKYGLKGMIDASIRVNVESSGNGNDEKIVPLEFKTGKVPSAQSSMEHCAQVILYTLLMSDRYLKHINCGLLYYLQSEQTQGIMVQRSDLVGLIMRRNELANDILNASKTQQLPPMLKVPSMCRGCRHLQSCTVYHKAHGGSTESSGLGDLFESHVHHLTTVHFSFLRHWDRLIDLEAREMQLVKNQIWHSSGRSNSGLSSVVLDSSSGLQRCKDNRFVYRFVRQNLTTGNANGFNGNSLTPPDSPASDLDCTLKSGDFVILSTESGHRTVASGFITDISHAHVLVSFSKCLRLPESSTSGDAEDIYRQVWRIDKDEAMTLFSVMRFNLVQLFIQKAESSQLRKMIVDLEAPRFDSGCIFSQDPATSYIWSEKGLNDDQRRAILKILTAKDYALILGMPGTGKTSTLVHAVKALLMRGSSILLTSYTNSAVDNLLVKLKAQNIDFLRIGRHEAVRDEIQGHCLSAMKIYSVEQINKRLDQVKVVAVTCLGITNPLLANKRFDVCIMDEAGQTTLPVSLGPLMFASMFVLVGDHYQLPPLVQSSEAREKGMEISLFRRLSEAHPQAISALQSQYRMCRGIMELSNALIYGDRLRCGSSEIADAKIEASNVKSYSSWLKEVLDPSRPVLFINTDMLPAFEVKDHKTLKNPIEACIIAKITEELVSSEIESKDIGIITPYNSQVNLIRNAVQNSSVEIHTIDKYQGRDKDCILVSFVRSSENPRNCNSSLLGDWHRINVALTRAKKKLIMVGSCTTLSKVPLLKLLIDKVDEQTGILILSKKDINHLGDLKRCSHFHT